MLTHEDWQRDVDRIEREMDEAWNLSIEMDRKKVCVIMGNDYPMEVTTPEKVQARMKELREMKMAEWEKMNPNPHFGPRYSGSGDYWIRSFEFEVK